MRLEPREPDPVQGAVPRLIDLHFWESAKVPKAYMSGFDVWMTDVTTGEMIENVTGFQLNTQERGYGMLRGFLRIENTTSYRWSEPVIVRKMVAETRKW